MPDKDYEIALPSGARIMVSIDIDDFETALTHAIEDLKQNHEKYLGQNR